MPWAKPRPHRPAANRQWRSRVCCGAWPHGQRPPGFCQKWFARQCGPRLSPQGRHRAHARQGPRLRSQFRCRGRSWPFKKANMAAPMPPAAPAPGHISTPRSQRAMAAKFCNTRRAAAPSRGVAPFCGPKWPMRRAGCTGLSTSQATSLR